MLSPLFNLDMDQRLADLHDALSAGKHLKVTFAEAYEHKESRQPDRLVVDVVGTARRLVFGTEVAVGVADQLALNGFSEAAAIRTRIAESRSLGEKHDEEG